MPENGKLPQSSLSPIAQGQLRKDAAAAWNAMNVEAREKGLELVPTGSMSSYRTYDQQVYLYNQYINGTGNLAAVPGTSNHGWGLAVDVPTQDMRSMIDHIGEHYGWAKKWSDAPSEWWHLKWLEGHWTGPDPGPYASQQPPPQALIINFPPGGDLVALAVMQNKDGRLELFVEKDDGSVSHLWQTTPNGKWNGKWESLGKP
jgi:hypothetical protein